MKFDPVLKDPLVTPVVTLASPKSEAIRHPPSAVQAGGRLTREAIWMSSVWWRGLGSCWRCCRRLCWRAAVTSWGMPRRPRRPLRPIDGFTLLAANGGPAPGGGTYANDFEPGGLNNRGQYSYAADVSTGGEGVFSRRGTTSAQIIRSGDPAPGGGTFGPFGIFGHAALNDPGDLAFAFNGDPFTLPLGLNSGVYRFTASSNVTTAILVPFVTPAPTGGVFQGAVIHASINNGRDVAFAGIINTTAGISVPPNLGLGVGVFRSDREGALTSVVVPGDPAPGGCNFDFAQNPWINDAGAIAFGAHLACDECKQLGTTRISASSAPRASTSNRRGARSCPSPTRVIRRPAAACSTWPSGRC